MLDKSLRKLVSFCFMLAIGTVVFISWVEISDSLSWTAIAPQSGLFWDLESLTPQSLPHTPEPDDPSLTVKPPLHRKDYKRLPYWIFDDQYRRVIPERTSTCTSSLRKTIDEIGVIKSMVIPDIRMWVHNGSITTGEWNRLSHFNNPFGFMDYDELLRKIVMAALSLVPKPSSPLLEPVPGGCIRCAVVGAGGVLAGSKKGKEIDAHDYVFRVNGAVIKGFEEDVGNRTSVYVHTAHSITTSKWLCKKYNYTNAPHDEGIKYVLIPEGMRDFEWMLGLYKGEKVTNGTYKGRRPRDYYSGQFNESRFYVFHQDFLRYVRNRFLKSPTLNNKLWAIVRPTNGAFAMFLALHVCDQVSAYGFMVENHKKYSNYYYERGTKKTHVIFYANHDYIMEMKLWKRLHDLNIINLYQGEEEPKR